MDASGVPGDGARHKRWLPLEANPEVLNRFMAAIGVRPETGLAFCDVYGLDPELLGMVPAPVRALLLLFPISEATEEARAEEAAAIERDGQEVSADVWYTKQTIGNACGTIGVLHALANNRARLSVEGGSFLDRFLEATAPMSPAEKAAFLEDPPAGAPDIESTHSGAATEGQSRPPTLEESVFLHFVCLVPVAGTLYELDGRKASAINHGPTGDETFLNDAVGVVRKFFAQGGGNIQFNLIALAGKQEMW